MKIAIVGGGNIGTQLAVHCSQQNETFIYTSTPELFIPDIRIVNERDEVTLTGKDIHACSDEKTVFSGADYILITYPAFMMGGIAEKLKQFVHKDLRIGIFPGTGGGECAFREHIAGGATVFGLQRVPSVARLVEKGKTVRAVGYRDQLYLASMPAAGAKSIADDISKIIGIPCDVMPNYLNLTLTPSNPILHTTRLRTIFKDYHKGVFYDKIPLIYEDWDDESSELLFLCDDEVQKVCSSLDMFDLSFVRSLRVHYESPTPHALTEKIRSIEGFKGLPTPAIRTDSGYVPDFSARYFSADFSYGLSILVQIGDFLGIDIPNMRATLEWYRSVSDDRNHYDFGLYGINDLKDFIGFYSM